MTTHDDPSTPKAPAVRRGRWALWLLAPSIVGAGVGAALASRTTPSYQSEALIVVAPARVPESYGRSTASTTLSDRLHTISQQILSRTRLERIIHDFDLYSEERRRGGELQEMVEIMRKNVVVEIHQDNAFRVGFIGPDPRTVMTVAERLTSLVIQEDLRDRELLAEATSQFLLSQLEDVRRRLVEKNRQRRAVEGAGTPGPEAEVLAIEYGALQTTFNDLLTKTEEARTGRNVVRGQMGEQFTLLAVPRLPQHPVSPDWRDYAGIGAAAGAAAGLLVLLLGSTTSLRERRRTPQAGPEGVDGARLEVSASSR